MNGNKNISRNRYIIFIAAFVALYVVWTLTSYAFEEGIIFWNFNFSLNFWSIALNLLLLLIVLIGWIMLPGRLFYIAMRKSDGYEKMDDIMFETIIYFIGIIFVSLIMSLPVVSYSPSELNNPIGEGVHMAKFGQKLYDGIWFAGTVGNKKGCGVTLGSNSFYPFTDYGNVFKGESAIVEGFSTTESGFTKENLNITLREIYCPGDAMLSRGIFEIKKVNP